MFTCFSVEMPLALFFVGLCSLYPGLVSAWTVPSKQGPEFGIINCDLVASSMKRFCQDQMDKRGVVDRSADPLDWLSSSVKNKLPGRISNNVELLGDYGTDTNPGYPEEFGQEILQDSPDFLTDEALVNSLQAINKLRKRLNSKRDRLYPRYHR